MYKEIRGLCTIHGSLAVLLQKQGNLPECSVTCKHFICLTMRKKKKCIWCGERGWGYVWFYVFDFGRGVWYGCSMYLMWGGGGVNMHDYMYLMSIGGMGICMIPCIWGGVGGMCDSMYFMLGGWFEVGWFYLFSIFSTVLYWICVQCICWVK